MSKIFVIGGRRGLGKAIVDTWGEMQPQDVCCVTSRKADPRVQFVCDLSRQDQVGELLDKMDQEKPERVFCVAGAGPYGSYLKKEWKDHDWALQVSLLSPLRITHHCLRADYCQQIILVGSSVAESSPDPQASSYSAAKHGLKGFVASVRGEELGGKDLRLFSPPYMDTDMLPVNAAAREAHTIYSPVDVGREFVHWALDPQAAWHKVYTL
ncbi:MAG: SDR family oxidoreductase [Bdellovibrionaceae bacterium]|nr:SDR family oxidoreductase [Pseudobdellovibrionaceae bacterium]